MAVGSFFAKIGADRSDFNKKMSKMESRMKQVGSKFTSIGKKMSLGITAPIALMGVAAIKFASDYEEALNKVDVAFGNSANSVKEFAKTSLTSFGIAEGSALDMAALFGDMGTSMGLTTKEAAEMSTKLVALSGDMASFKNVSIDRAQTALRGIFTGEGEALKGLGKSMTVANLQTFALNQGLTKTVKNMTQAEQVTLRYKFILSKSANEMGDFARTGGGAANQMRIFQEGLKELGQQFGSVILPAFTKLTVKANKIIAVFKKLSPGMKKTIIIVAGIAAAIGPLLLVIGGLISIAPAMGAAFSVMFGPIGLIILAVGALVTAIIVFRKEIVASFKGVVAAAKALANNVINNFKQIPKLVIEALREIPQAFIDVFSGIIDVVAAIIKGDFKALPALLKDVGKDMLKANPLTAIGIKIGGEFGKGVGDAFSNAFGESMEENKQEIKDEVNDTLGDGGGDLDIVVTPKLSLEDFLKQLDEGLTTIREATSPLVSAIDSVNEAFNRLDAEAEVLGTGSLETLKAQQVALEQSMITLAEAGLQGSQAYQDFAEKLLLLREEIPLLIEQEEAFRLKQEQLIEVGQAVGKVVGDGFQKMSDKIVDGLELADTGFEGFAKGLIGTITKIISMMLSQATAQAIAGASASAAGTGPAAVFTLPAFIATAVGGIIGAFAAIPSFAEGTSSAPGGLSLVGELGPELMNVPRGASITPNNMLGDVGGQERLVAEISGDDILFFIDRARARQSRSGR